MDTRRKLASNWMETEDSQFKKCISTVGNSCDMVYGVICPELLSNKTEKKTWENALVDRRQDTKQDVRQFRQNCFLQVSLQIATIKKTYRQKREEERSQVEDKLLIDIESGI